MHNQPQITSFVIRFVHENPVEPGSAYKGHILHVQTNEECHFSDWQDAVAFMQGYLPIPLMEDNEPPPAQNS